MYKIQFTIPKNDTKALCNELHLARIINTMGGRESHVKINCLST